MDLSRIAVLSIALSFMGLSAAYATPEKQVERLSEIRAYLDESLAVADPGVAIGIVVDDDIVFEHYAGIANLDHQIPISEKTRFNIASNAKQFTALMLLDLADQGRVDLSADFRTYLPEALPSIDQTISSEQLITHTSGIRDIYDLLALTGVTWYERPLDSDDALELLNAQTDLNFAPDTDHRYSNSNYILMAALIEAVTETPFHKYAKQFFADRGMPETVMRRRYGAIVPNRASAYGKWSGWLEDPSIANTEGDGFLYTTLKDQLHWEQQIWGNRQTLASDVIETSQGPLKTIASTDSYGFGVEFSAYKGLSTTSHIGSTGGFNAYFLRFPQLETSIVVMGNSANLSVVGMGRRVADLWLQEQFPAEDSFARRPEKLGPETDPAKVLGLYELESGDFISITERDGALYRELDWGEPDRLIKQAGNVYSYENNRDLQIAFLQTPGTEARFELYAPEVAVRRAVRIPNPPDGEAYRKSLQGRFWNEETETEIIFTHTVDDDFKMIKNGRERNIRLRGNDLLAWNAYRMRPERNAAGQIVGLRVDNRRIQNVWFERVD